MPVFIENDDSYDIVIDANATQEQKEAAIIALVYLYHQNRQKSIFSIERNIMLILNLVERHLRLVSIVLLFSFLALLNSSNNYPLSIGIFVLILGFSHGYYCGWVEKGQFVQKQTSVNIEVSPFPPPENKSTNEKMISDKEYVLSKWPKAEISLVAPSRFMLSFYGTEIGTERKINYTHSDDSEAKVWETARKQIS